MMEYIVAQAPSAVELQMLVESLIERGFLPLGGLAVADGIFYQSMTKSVDN